MPDNIEVATINGQVYINRDDLVRFFMKSKEHDTYHGTSIAEWLMNFKEAR